MLRRTPFKRPTYTPPPPAPPARASRTATYAGTTTGQKVEKECASQSIAYQKAAKALGYCMRCGWQPPWGTSLDFCHADQGKGTGIKTDVRRGWPGCRLCHDFVGASGAMPKAERRALEDQLGAKTRAAILAAGTWPPSLPLYQPKESAMTPTSPNPMPPLSEEEVQALEAQREQSNENLRRKLAKVLPWSERAEA